MVEEPDFLSYCRQKWGSKVYREALNQTPLLVYHEQTSTVDNILVSLEADVTHLPGYLAGPVGFKSEERLGGFFVTESSPLADVVKARPLVRERSAASMIKLAKSWLRSCMTTHAACAEQLPVSQPEFRLVDLRQYPTLFVCEGLSRVDQYAALSYRWGNQVPLKLTSSTLAQFSARGLQLDDLPATIKDACHLCRELEIPFLWVDCLCIMQDLVSDWNQQAIQMGQIFSQAVVVIRAAAGNDCTHGLFRPRELASDAVSELNCIAPDGRAGLCSIRGPLRSSQPEPLDTRSWALQEDILAHRAVTFGQTEMSWDCTQHHSESGFQPMTSVRAAYLQMQHGPFRTKDKRDISIRFWKSVLLDYTTRDLTLPRDKLAAIAGLQWWFAKSAGVPLTDNIAGLWKTHLPQALLWFHRTVTGTDVSKPTRSPPFRAPSWSWAAWDFEDLGWEVKSADPAVAIVLDSTVTKTLVESGELVRGTVTIRSPQRCGFLLPSYHYPEFYTLWEDDWREASQKRGPGMPDHLVGVGNVYLDSFEPLSGTGDEGEPQAEIAVPVQCLQITRCWCLLVQKTADSNGDPAATWTRLGVARMYDACASTWWENAEPGTLAIV